MHYQFPIIEHIDDVLPHIKGRSEFIVAEREFGKVINYVVTMPDSFDMTGPNDIGGAIRRECRGITFDKSGKISSRKYHKFFNISERDETQVSNLDFSKSHIIMEKCDGSMITPLIFNNTVRTATKMGIETDVAEQPQKWLSQQNKSKTDWLRDMCMVATTPIFEWTSPNNRIVVKYDIDDLILTGIRDNITGKYLDINSFNSPFTIVKTYGSVDIPVDEYISKSIAQVGREGDVIRWADGHMAKLKNTHYVQIHKTKDRIRSNRNIVELMLSNSLDDLYPFLDKIDSDRVREFEKSFWNAFRNKEYYLEKVVSEIIEKSCGDRKYIALNIVPSLPDKTVPMFVYGKLSDKSINNMLMKLLEKNMFADARFEEFWIWLNNN